MASVRPEVVWSPTLDDTFLVWSSNLELYQTIGTEEALGAQYLKLNEKCSAKLIATNNNYQYIKCVSWYHGPKDDVNHQLIAVGLTNGRIGLTNFARKSDLRSGTCKEYVAKNCRPVNSLAWNPKYHQYLAAGLDRAGKDNSLIVIDLSRGGSTPPYYYDRNTSTGADSLRPHQEFNPGETVQSVEFSRHDPQIILAGVNNRMIKLFDMRSGKVETSFSTKAAFNIVSDPFVTHRFASSHENVVYIWDVRNLERSVLNLSDTSNKTISKLSWSPTRYGYLACLPRDCSCFRLYDIHRNEAQKEDHEPMFITRSISTDPSNALISSFSWHPTHQNRVTIASYSGQLRDQVVIERVMMDLSNRNCVVWSSGKGVLKFTEDELLQHIEDDISTIIKKRAIRKYGLKTDDLAVNGEIGNEAALLNLWTWLEEGRKLVRNSDFKMPEGNSYKFHGVWNILNSTSLKSDILNKQWAGFDGLLKNVHAKVFRSDERSLALALCSWDTDPTILSNFMKKLESNGHYTRAAAISVFNLHIPRAIKILQRGSAQLNDPSLNTTAMALAGFTNERKALWRETCSSLLKLISDPYIRATFAFLTGEAENFDAILQEPLLMIQDRVAFACKYLSDVRLIEYLKSLKLELTKQGDLDGILLTGLDEDGEDLLQRYIDITGDVQTAAFVAIHALQIEPNSRPGHWVEQYRNLLNNLQLWKERAMVDVLKNSLSISKSQKKFPQQIYVSCNFCVKSISAYVQAPGRSRNHYARFGTSSTQKSKMTLCPNPSCRKPLPRCSLCLQHMGTPSKRGTSKALSVDDQSIQLNGNVKDHSTKVLSSFNVWFTWCQACYHGGHSNHMMEWFKEYSECPVSSCNCKCMDIDGAKRLAVSVAR